MTKSFGPGAEPEHKPFRLGINYWPVSSAMYWWRRFDEREVERDFARISRAGFDSARIFLLWEDFQPSPDQVSVAAIDRLLAVADIAFRNDLYLVPTLFTGHMSGVNWIPEWALDTRPSHSRFRLAANGIVVQGTPKNWYSDQRVLEAQALLANQIANALRNHPAMWAYDLGNENSNCVRPPDRESAVAWLKTIAHRIREADPVHPITLGLHAEDLEEDRRLGPAEAAAVCDFLCMHGYPIYLNWARNGTDELVLPFLGTITRWLGGRDVFFEEFGAPSVTSAARPNTAVQLLEEAEAAAYTRRALRALRRFGLTGAMLWCYGDYDSSLRNSPPLDKAIHERYFGLWRSYYSEKPLVSEVARFASEVQSSETANLHSGLRDDFDWIDIEPEDYYTNPQQNIRRLYREFCARYG